VISEGQVIGGVVLLNKAVGRTLGTSEARACEVAASFLGAQME